MANLDYNIVNIVTYKVDACQIHAIWMLKSKQKYEIDLLKTIKRFLSNIKGHKGYY